MWDRLLWASSGRRMESQKPQEGSCWVPAVTFPSVCYTHAWEFSFTALLWGRKLLPPLQKWGVRRWPCSPGDPQEVCGKAEDEFNIPLCSYGLLTPPSFPQAVSSLDNRQSQSGFSPLSLPVWTLQTGSNCTDLLPSSEIILPRAVYKTGKAQLQSSELNLLYRLEPTCICLPSSFHEAGNTIKTTNTKVKSMNKNFYY